jgi:hypothetical protein
VSNLGFKAGAIGYFQLSFDLLVWKIKVSTTGATQMARTGRKPPTSRIPAAAVAHRFGELPGAVF